MKKSISVLIIFLLFFNWFGYRLLTAYMKDHAGIGMIEQIEHNNFEQTDLVSIKIPAKHLVSYANSNMFERIDGTIEIEGVQYNYVKRRLYNDSLELLCIPNRELLKWKVAENDLFKIINGLQYNGQNRKTDNHSIVSKNYSPDYYMGHDLFTANNFFVNLTNRTFHYSAIMDFQFSAVIYNPPEA